MMNEQFHRCPSCGHEHEPAKKPATVAAPTKGRLLTVDLHCHLLTPEVEQRVADQPGKKEEVEMYARHMGAESTAFNQTLFPSLLGQLTDLPTRLKDMEESGTDVQVISPSPFQYYYWAGRDLAEENVRAQNERIAEVCAAHTDRFRGLGAIALQHPDLAVEQLVYMVKELGFKGFEVATLIDGEDIASPRFEPVWAKAEELGVIVFLHPIGTGVGERLSRYYFNNVIGHPIETTIGLSHLIFGGVLDRYPGLKFVAAHGGGYLPSYLGRSDHGHSMRPEAQTTKRKPSEYFRQIWVDTIVFRPQGLRHLIAEIGVDRLVVGTDYPFDMGAYNIHELLAELPELTDDERAAILGGNALDLLGLPRDAFSETQAGTD